MNPLVILGGAVAFMLFLGQSNDPKQSNTLPPNYNEIDLGNGLIGFPRIQIEEKGQKAPLMIVIHGRASNEKQLQDVVPKDLKARVIFLRGQIPGEVNPKGRFFFLPRLKDAEDKVGPAIQEAGKIVDNGIKKLLSIYPTSKVIILGFSQGGAMSLYLGSLGKYNTAIGFSGSLPSNLFPKDKKPTRILMWHGDKDSTVPYELGKDTADAFVNSGYLTEFITGEGKSHIFPPKSILNKYLEIAFK